MSYQQLEQESAPAYQAFIRYCELGPQRSIDTAYRASIGQEESNKTASGRWTKWSQDYRWVERAKAWDAEQVLAVVEHRKAEHLSEIADYKKNRLETATKSFNTANNLLDRVNERISNLEKIESIVSQADPEDLTIGEIKAITFATDLKTIAFALLAASKVMHAALDDKAHGLAINKLLEKMEVSSELERDINAEQKD